MPSDGSGSERSWSLVSNEGDLADSDDYSLSDSSVIINGESEEETDSVSTFASDDEQTDLTDIDDEEIDEEDEKEENQNEEEKEEYRKEAETAEIEEPIFFAEKLNYRSDRRIRIMVLTTMIMAVIVGLMLGSTFGDLKEQCISEPKMESPFRWATPLKDSESELLSQCHRNLEDAAKTTSINSVLMRYMRVKNDRLQSLLAELQSLVEIQKRALDEQSPTLETETPLQSESISIPPSAPLASPPPTDFPEEPKSVPQFLPDDQCSLLMPCSPSNGTLYALTKSLIRSVAKLANSSALSAIVDTNLSKWTKTTILKGNHWSRQFGSYVRRVGRALSSSPAITGLAARYRSQFVVPLRRSLRSAIQSIIDLDVCDSEWVCTLTEPLAAHLYNSTAFTKNLTAKESASYNDFLRHIPPRQCTLNSTLINCERCWWSGDCGSLKKKCSPRRWQKQKRVDPKALIAADPDVQPLLAALQWLPQSSNDWILRRAGRRAENRKTTEKRQDTERWHRRRTDWLWMRHSTRAALRRSP